MSKKSKTKCVDCSRECTGIRCKSCSNKHKAICYPRNLIELKSLMIDKLTFTAHDAAGVVLPVKMKFQYNCDKCNRSYNAALEFERRKKYPWHCKACAISLEWSNVEYRTVHVTELKKSNSTPEAKSRLSELSKSNWCNDDIRRRMLVRDKVASSIKGKLTRLHNLLSGKTSHITSHGKRVLVGSTWMRSTYEARFATLLTSNSIEWMYEPKWFEVGDGKAYLPDFYVPYADVYVEVKGWWRDDAKEKFNEFVRMYPNVKYALVTRVELEALEKLEKTLEDYIIEARR